MATYGNNRTIAYQYSFGQYVGIDPSNFVVGFTVPFGYFAHMTIFGRGAVSGATITINGVGVANSDMPINSCLTAVEIGGGQTITGTGTLSGGTDRRLFICGSVYVNTP